MKLVLLLILVLSLFTGCGKKYSDYSNIWISEDGMVMINPTEGTAKITYKGIDQKKNINILSDNGQVNLCFCYGKVGSADASDWIWEADARIKKDVLYLTIKKDNILDFSGKTIILKQQEKQ